MAKPGDLKNPPIVEALIDLRVKARDGFSATEFLDLKAELAAKYPRLDERRQVRFQTAVPLTGSGVIQQRTEDLGVDAVLFRSVDGKDIAQFRIDGFTLNRLARYTGWEAFSTEALALWREYTRLARPQEVIRIALRYINRLTLPHTPTLPFERYLTCSPRVPPELPAKLAGFLSNVKAVHAAKGCFVNVTQVLEEPAGDGLALILDIDAFATKGRSSNTEEIALVLQRLRKVKNEAFFAHLTDLALEPYR